MTNSVYPGQQDTFDLLSDPEMTVTAEPGDGALDLPDTVKKLVNCVVAMEGELGNDPAGASATIRARLDAITSEVLSVLTFKGTWNASTNSPNLGASSPDVGEVWIVNVAGATSLGGVTDWKVGDWALYTGAWEKVDHTDAPHADSHLLGGTDEIPGLWTPRVSAARFLSPMCLAFSTVLATAAELRAFPMYVPDGETWNLIRGATTVGGAANSVCRAGIWADNGEGEPGVLVAEATQVSTGIGNLEFAISEALDGGLYWFGLVAQGVPATEPTLRTANNFLTPVGTTGLMGGIQCGRTRTGITGALPDPFGTPGDTTTCFELKLRRA